MSIQATEVRKGMVIYHEGGIYTVLEVNHVTPGNWRAMIQTKMKNIQTGSNLEVRFKSFDKIETAYIEQKELEYLYDSADAHVFMDQSTYEEVHVQKTFLAESIKFMKPNTVVKMNYIDGNPIGVQLPSNVDLLVTHTEPGLKGATATNQYKPATTETGLVVQVPPFVNQGDVIRVDTETGEYIERVKS